MGLQSCGQTGPEDCWALTGSEPQEPFRRQTLLAEVSHTLRLWLTDFLLLNHRNFSAKQTKKSLSSFNSNRMSCSLLATGSGTEDAAKRERRRQGGSRGPRTAHPADLFYLEARGLGACHPHLLTGQKEHLQDGGRRGGAVLPRAGWTQEQAEGVTRGHTSRPTGPPQRASRAHSGELVFSPPTQNQRTPNTTSISKDKKSRTEG